MVFNFFTNKTFVTKPIFGQPYLTASGYDDKHEELYHKNETNLNICFIAKNVQITTGVMEHFADYQELCNIFQTSNLDLLKLIANEKSNIENILTFIYQHQGRFTLICNLNIICHEATLQDHSKEKPVTRPIQKLLLGHNVMLCIPLTTPISNTNIVQYIQSLILRKSNGSIPEYLLSNAAALIDYREVIKMLAFEILNGLSEYQFSNEVISLFVELPKLERKYLFKNDKERESLSIAIILKLKKLMYLMEEQFGFVRDHDIGRKILSDDEKMKAAEAIITGVEKLKNNMDCSAFPPADITALYHSCCFYEKQYFTALYDGIELPLIYSSLHWHLETAYIFLIDLPFKKTDNIWLMKINDDKANELRQKYLIDKMSILFTPKTKFLIDGFINENIVHVLSEETKWKNSTEPVLSLNERTEVLFGMCTPGKTKKEIIQNGNVVFLDFCKCKIDAEPKAWVCEKCKHLLRIVDKNFVYCECGVQKITNLVKKCFKCSPVQEENKVEKKTLNILFIGQTGAGKSMLINSMYNYLNTSFDEVSKAKTVDCISPCHFQLQTPDSKKVVFTAGPQDMNEHFNDNGESVTQLPKVYKFETEKYDCKVIDTPGLGDTRGAKQDEYNLNLIRNVIIDIKDLHAINFVMPSNISKLTANFEFNMLDLLSLFPKTALKNVNFFFTYSNSTFFTIGDTRRKKLEEFISTLKATNNADIPFCPENVFCVDSEAFMYFIATKQGHKYQNRDLESFRISWNKSKEAIERFLAKMESIIPIKSADILMTYELEQIGLLLQKESNPKLAELIAIILTKISQMTSKFIFTNIKNLQTTDEFKKEELFQALNLCQYHVYDPNLKQLINKLLKEYGPTAEVIESRGLKSNNHKSRVDKDLEDISKPVPPERFHSQWPNMEQLKNIVEKLGEEWENGKIFKNQIENVVNVQIAANQKLEQIDKKKLKESLNIIMMYVSIELEKDISDLLKACFFTKNKVFVSQKESQKVESGTKLMETQQFEPLTVDNKNVFAFPKRFTNESHDINAVGIDLGTSRCCVAVNRRNGIETIPLDNNGDRLLPSYVGYDEPHTKCGQIVIDRLRYYSKATVFDSKRMIGKSMVVIDKIWPFKVIHENDQPVIKLDTERGEIQQTAAEVAAVLLKYMKEKAEAFQGKKLSKVVITVPAAFTSLQKEATKEAARLTGWEIITLLPEPIAASFAYFIDRPIQNNSTLLLFDLGGGTLDVCVFRITDDKIQIISKNGDSKLGGRDFDNLLMDYFSNKLAIDYEITNLGDRKYKLLMECQKIKHNLSVRYDDKLDVEEINPTKEGLIKITQQNFYDLAEDLLNKIQNTIFSALYKSRYTADQIDKVLQVGGGCRMPMIKQLLQDIFPTAEHCCEEHPDEVVAIGAAYYAYNIFSTN